MKQSVEFEKQNLFVLRVREDWTPVEVKAIADRADKLVGDTNPIRYLIDLGQTRDIPSAAREMITKRARKDVIIEKAAVFGAKARIRFLVRWCSRFFPRSRSFASSTTRRKPGPG